MKIYAIKTITTYIALISKPVVMANRIVNKHNIAATYLFSIYPSSCSLKMSNRVSFDTLFSISKFSLESNVESNCGLSFFALVSLNDMFLKKLRIDNAIPPTSIK